MRVAPGDLALGAHQVPLPLLTVLAMPGTMHYMEPGNDVNWLGQVRKGVAEQCVLALLTTGEKYGVELARELTARGRIIGSEGTLYPMLARLRRNGLVETSWQESNCRTATPLLPPHRRRRTRPRQLQETVARFSRRRR